MVSAADATAIATEWHAVMGLLLAAEPADDEPPSMKGMGEANAQLGHIQNGWVWMLRARRKMLGSFLTEKKRLLRVIDAVLGPLLAPESMDPSVRVSQY